MDLCTTLLLPRCLIREAVGFFQHLVAAVGAGLDAADVSHNAHCYPDVCARSGAASISVALDYSHRLSSPISVVHVKCVLSLRCSLPDLRLHFLHANCIRRQVAFQQVQRYGAISSIFQYCVAFDHNFRMLLWRRSAAAASAAETGEMARAT